MVDAGGVAESEYGRGAGAIGNCIARSIGIRIRRAGDGGADDNRSAADFAEVIFPSRYSAYADTADCIAARG